MYFESNTLLSSAYLSQTCIYALQSSAYIQVWRNFNDTPLQTGVLSVTNYFKN
jgi:hypothetical protein